MNADKRRWICGCLVSALLGAKLLAHVQAKEVQSQLSAEIERRYGSTFEDFKSERLIDAAFPLTRELEKPRKEIQPLKLNFEYEASPPPSRSEGVDSLPQPTLVEHFIAKGFPSGELSQDATMQDDSYLFARDLRAFRGMGFSR